ncbi:MAG: SDR family NAD(P)-dependent oxidoreductase [Opitutaceae bacterium]|nr:SDR family NAD(P)-dependent oxidoreductase [Opitutaceae bacterium]
MSDSHLPPVWFITGCSSGLGRALALHVLGRGHRLVATARNPDTLYDLVAQGAGQCRALTLDVTQPDHVTSAIASAVAAFGRIDVVVNNAGCGLAGALEELDEDQIQRCFETNFFGAMRLTRAALPILRAQRRGHFVMISAAAAIANYPGFSIYGAAKWALEGMAEALAAEVRPLGLGVTIVQPGPFRTAFVSRSLERGSERLPDYDGTSGRFLRLIESMEGRQPGDPAKAAEAIVAAVEAEQPPLRLVLGKYANDKARRKLAAMARELDTWAAPGIATDFSAASAGRTQP